MPKALPNRKNIVLTKNNTYKAEGAIVVSSIEEALAEAGDDSQPFVIGGAQIYSLFLDHCDRIELTRVHHEFEADVFFPKIDSSKWNIVSEEFISKSEDQPYDYTYITYDKK
jgi:dihydrofolate reductase